MEYIPINFMLGFFVTSVLNRWINFFNNIGYIDKLVIRAVSFPFQLHPYSFVGAFHNAMISLKNNLCLAANEALRKWIRTVSSIGLMVAAYVRGTDEKTRMQRRNIVRYCVLSQALVFRDISMRVRKRFPTVDALVAAGFMMEHEKELFDQIQYRYAKYWMPFQWALALCQEARTQQKIASDIILQKVGEVRIFCDHEAFVCFVLSWPFSRSKHLDPDICDSHTETDGMYIVPKELQVKLTAD
ncbi:unnamed protein product [Anisakis simplex]|uniref:Bestrophin homolog n=1 Tax=Anisakis simplex TaxID=6269 RepID=A0A3P6NFL4_ANISI|nr:unnamed protein product [Anisakis simplex]